MATLKGSRELKRRLKAIKTAFKPIGRVWADETVKLASRRVKVRTGQTKRSIRRKNASMKKASVEARGGARFLEAGTKVHEMKPRRMRVMKYTQSGRPMFSKKVRHPGMRKQPFLRDSGRDVLRTYPLLDELIELWNKAA